MVCPNPLARTSGHARVDHDIGEPPPPPPPAPQALAVVLQGSEPGAGHVRLLGLGERAVRDWPNTLLEPHTWGYWRSNLATYS